jgi:hypothetical protein
LIFFPAKLLERIFFAKFSLHPNISEAENFCQKEKEKANFEG